MKIFEVNEEDKMQTKSKNQFGNTFAQHEELMNQKPSVKITSQDSLISVILDVIDKEFGHKKLNEDDVTSVIKIINDR